MNKNRKGRPNITREIYKGVKKYDRQQFDAFCLDIYESGFSDGRESVPGIDIKKVMGAIREVKGIGEKKVAAIKEKLEQLFIE